METSKNILISPDFETIIKNLLKEPDFHKLIKRYDNDNNLLIKLIEILKISFSKYEYSFNIPNNVSTTLKNKHNQYMKEAAAYARNADLGHKHGCVIVYNNNIISWGYNHKHKSLKDYSIHAEIDAINRLNKKYKSKKIISNCSLYVVRIRNGLNEEDILKMSKPCMNCAKKINKIGIRKVYYSVDNDYVKDFIYTLILKNSKN